MPVTASYQTYVLDQLAAFGGVDSKRMFSGFGLYRDGVFFGLIYDDAVYLKVDDETRPEYERRGMTAFAPPMKKGSKQGMVSKNYFQLPDDVLSDSDALNAWATRALAAAKAKTKPARKKPPTAAKRSTTKPRKKGARSTR